MAKTCLTMFSLGRSILNIPSREATTLVVRETESTDWPSSALTSADPETRELVERIRGTAGDHVPVNDGPSQPGLSDPKIPADRPSLAVLPFENMSGDTEQDYFADGITDDIITGLSKSRMFFVVARNSTFTYKRSNVDVRRVARELGVQYVVEGSVRRAGNRVRITSQLIDASADKHVWAERYDRELKDVRSAGRNHHEHRYIHHTEIFVGGEATYVKDGAAQSRRVG